MFDGKSVLITGGTGSFGNAMVNYILEKFKPERLIIFSRDEAKQYNMQVRLKHDCLRFFIGDVRDAERLKMAFHGVDIVIHAAALKHVPAAEYNPMECIKTNVLGASNIINVALESEVRTVLALSTDKAANPINLYGASKLAADKLFIAANNVTGRLPTRFSIVRYGNVINSRGSAVDTFRQLLKQGEKSLPLTDPRMTRFWITLSQGVEFVAKSIERMKGGEIFVPKIPSSLVTDLIRAMAPDLAYHTIGIRPGEKLHEVLCPRDSAPQTIEFKDFYLIAPSITMQGECSYLNTRLGETGAPVTAEFEYSSDSNQDRLTVEQLKELLASNT